MNKFLRNVFLLGTLGLITYILIAFVVFQTRFSGFQNMQYKTWVKSPGYSYKKFIEFDKSDKKFDLIFLGSSHCYLGFNPILFDKNGYTSYNLGSGAQTPYNSYYLLKHYIDKKSVNKIIVDVYWKMLMTEPTESTMDFASNMKPNLASIDMVFMHPKINCINNLLFSLLNFNNWEEKSKVIENIYGQYQGKGFVTRKETQEGLGNLPKHNFVPNKGQMSYLSNLIELCNKNSIELVLVKTPVTSEYYSSLNGHCFDSTIKDLAEKHQIKFLNFNVEPHKSNLGLNTNSHFFDKSHLNVNGTEIFNEYLLSLLQ